MASPAMPKARQLQRARREEQAASPLDAAFKLVDSLAVPVFFKSRDGRYLGVNRAWEEFFGIRGEAFIGKQVADLYPQDPAIAEKHAAMDRELYAHPGRQSYEIAVRARDGRLHDTIYYKATYTDARGEVAGLIGAIIDITARTHAEAALRENEERWRAIVNSANEGILVYDRDLNVIAGNQAAERILGLPLAEIIGAAGFTSLLPFVHADGTPVAPDERPTRLTVRNGKTLSAHIIGIKRPGGVHTWLPVNTGFLRQPDSSDWYGVVSSFTDITAQRNAESALRESEERYRRTFELAGSGLAHVDLQGRFLRVNRRLCEILGYPEHELIGMTGRQISHPEDLDVINKERKKLYDGEIDHVRVEKRYVRKDGSSVWVTFSMVVERDDAGKPVYEIAIFDEITERKRAEAAVLEREERFRSLTQLSSDWYWEQDADFGLKFMSRRMGERTGLDAAAYIGRKRWDQPALNLSDEDWARHRAQLERHEPLRMVSSYTQLLAKRYGERFEGDAKEFMHYIVDGAARMKQLIEDLLAYSRVGTKGKEFKPVSVEAPLRKAISNLRAAIDESSAAVTWDPLPTVDADEGQLAQLFHNLMGNALKFRGPAVPRIHVSAADQDGEWHITLADNGIGIQPQYYERIFMLFQRLHTMGEYPGTGLGLAICKKVIERHGGRISGRATPR